ncbi:MAG: hypothetical protein ACI4V7_11810 [Succinivibrionaceae bacterium]
MQTFIKELNNSYKIGTRVAFLSTFQALAVIISDKKTFFISLLLSLSICISMLVPVMSFFTIPGVMTAYFYLLLNKIHGNNFNITQSLKLVNFHYNTKMLSFACLILIPTSLIIACGTYAYNSFSISPDTKHLVVNSPLAIYAILLTTFITLLWGITFMSSNILSMKENPSVLVCVVESIEALLKNPIASFILCVNWFMGIAFSFFLFGVIVVVLSQLHLNNLSYIIWHTILTTSLIVFFINVYIMNIAIITYQIFSKQLPESNTDNNNNTNE